MDEIDYGRMARCHQYNEELIAKVYREAADKVDMSCLKAAFLFIAYDSEKHAKIFSRLADIYNTPEFDPESCSLYSALAYGLRGHLLNIMKEIENSVDDKNILSVMKDLENIEISLAEADRDVLVNGIKDGKERALFNRILKYIDEDEKRHEKIVDDLIKMFK